MSSKRLTKKQVNAYLSMMPSGLRERLTMWHDEKEHIFTVTVHVPYCFLNKATNNYVSLASVTMPDTQEALDTYFNQIDFKNTISTVSTDTVRAMYRKVMSMPCVDTHTPRELTYVIDEEQSVRWNREENEKYNKSIEEATEKLKTEKNAAFVKLRNQVVDSLIVKSHCVLSREQANDLLDSLAEDVEMDFLQSVETAYCVAEFMYRNKIGM